MPGTVGLFVIEKNGGILAASDENGSRHLQDDAYLSDIEYMIDDSATYISNPYKNSNNEGTVKISIIDTPKKNNITIFTAIVKIEYFSKAISPTILSSDSTAKLSYRDGGVVFEFTERNAAGLDHEFREAAEVIHQPDRPKIVTTDDASSLGVNRIINNERLNMRPSLLLEIRRNLSLVEDSWINISRQYIGFILFLSIVGFGVIKNTHTRRERFSEMLNGQKEANHELTQRMTLTLASANVGLWDLTLPDMAIKLDERAAAIQGTRKLEHKLASSQWCAWIHPSDTEKFETEVRQHIAGNSSEFEHEYRIKHKDGHWVWVHSVGKIVGKDLLGHPTRMLGTLIDISRRKAHEQEIERLAFYDSLTNLPNRRLLRTKLDNIIKDNQGKKIYGAILFIDLDNFKGINDTLGHQRGDELLKKVATRLLKVTRQSDTVSRHGGDEFVILLGNVGATEKMARATVASIGGAILDQLALPYDLGEREVYSTPSIGAAIFNGVTLSTDDVLKQADLAMYSAKAAGRNTIRYFDPEMQRRIDEEIKLESDLRQAIARREFELHYQTIHNTNGAIIGAEALLRWPRPIGTYVSPADFIPLAEKTGLIIEIGNQVLDMACEQISSWCKLKLPDEFSVSVNVSPKQFLQSNFVSGVMQCLLRHHALPQRLKIELTEGIFVSNTYEVIEKMKTLQALGVRFSVDDFGTGYSSLSYLRNLPLSQLKIDRTFVSDLPNNLQNSTITRAIIGLACNLGLDVVAEGVENAEQLNFLVENGCSHFQGYYFSKPQPSLQVSKLLSSPKVKLLENINLSHTNQITISDV